MLQSPNAPNVRALHEHDFVTKQQLLIIITASHIGPPELAHLLAASSYLLPSIFPIAPIFIP